MMGFPAAAMAWDSAGHMLVDRVAWEQMKPEARERVGVLVQVLENTFNDKQAYSFVTSGCWMDDMRSKKGYAWSKWHYIDLPWTPDGVAFEVPEPPHVLSAIDEAIATVKAPGTSDDKASEALAILVHLVGDVHQPMHATDRGDRGGNGVIIHGISFSDLWSGSVPNLHAFWDKCFRFDAVEGKSVELWVAPATADRPKTADEGVIAVQAAAIMARFPASTLGAEIAKPTAADWARESHQIGCVSGYPSSFEPSDTHAVELTPEFVAKAHEIAGRRIALAGYRLAKLLNEILAPSAPAK